MLGLQAMPRLHGRPLQMGARQTQLVTRLQGRLRELMQLLTTRTLGKQQALRVPEVRVMIRQQAKHLALRTLEAPAMSRLQGRVRSASACGLAALGVQCPPEGCCMIRIQSRPVFAAFPGAERPRPDMAVCSVLLHACVRAETRNFFYLAAGTEDGEDPVELSSFLASLQTVLASKPAADMMGSQQDFLMPPPRGERNSCAHFWTAWWAPKRNC